MKKLIAFAVVATALLAAAAYVFLTHTTVGWLILNQNPGPFDRTRFEAVVKEVRLLGLKPGERRRLRLDDLGDPKSLRALNQDEVIERGRGAGNVWAESTSGGRLKVVIETRDLGHAGEYGFAYSDVPLAPQPFGDNWFCLDLPGHLNLVLPNMRIDDNWWEVLYNLD